MFSKAIVRGLVALAIVSCAVVARAITIETVPVVNADNVGEWCGSVYAADRVCGAVGYNFNIGKYEVTTGQYTAFLNAVGGVDSYGLYSTNMSPLLFNSYCGIARSGGGTVNNPYVYSVAADLANRPVNQVSYWDACRFANWLNNGQPTGAQGAGTTETGAYTLNGYNGLDGQTIQRNIGATWAVTSEDEWYKAAYYKGGGMDAGYWDYPTSSDTQPGRDMADVSGNNANYFDHNYLDSDKRLTLAGEFQNSDSPYGTFDQCGNTWEWNESVLNDSFRATRGGSAWRTSRYLLASCRYYGYSPTYESVDTGFRVASVFEFLLGDADQSGKVDVADLTNLLNNYNKTGMVWANGDFNHDGTVNVTDLTELLNNYNKSFGAGAVAGTAVPEPSSISMLAGIALTALLYGWRRRV